MLEIFAGIAVSVTRMLLQIDLRDHGADGLKLRRRGPAAATQQVQRILRDVTPGAAPLDDKQDLVRHGGEQPCLGAAEYGRTIDDDAVIAAAQLVQQSPHLVAREQDQRVEETAACREVVKSKLRDTLDDLRRFKILEQNADNSLLGFAVELTPDGWMFEAEIDQEHALLQERNGGRKTDCQRGLSFGGQAGGDQNDLRRVRSGRQLHRRCNRTKCLRIGRRRIRQQMLMRPLRCAEVRNERHKADAGNAERLADVALASQSAVKLLQDDGEQRSADEEHDQRGKNEQDRIRRTRPVGRRRKRQDIGVGRNGLLLIPDFLLTAQQRVVELPLRYGLTFEFLQTLTGFAGVARLLCSVPLCCMKVCTAAPDCATAIFNSAMRRSSCANSLREDARNCSL